MGEQITKRPNYLGCPECGSVVPWLVRDTEQFCPVCDTRLEDNSQFSITEALRETAERRLQRLTEAVEEHREKVGGRHGFTNAAALRKASARLYEVLDQLGEEGK